MAAIYLSEADVAALVDMQSAVDVVTEAFRRLAAGEAENVPRRRARTAKAMLHSMSAAADYLGRLAWKQYVSTRAGVQFLVGLYDGATGELLALVEANRLGQLRTGAATAVAVGCLADAELSELGLLGTGAQARGQLEAIRVVRPLRKVFVFGREARRRAAFADEMSNVLDMEILPVDRPSEAVEDLPIVVTATTSREPVFQGEWLADGALVCAIGSNSLVRAELDAVAVRRADTIVCDSIEACRDEAGDFVDAIGRGDFDWSRAVELCDVLTGRAVGRSHGRGMVIFKSVGLAIEDLAVASLAYDRALAAGRGRPLLA